jgi:zinc resistance-associated protein
MKKIWFTGLMAAFGIALIGTTVFAQCGMGYGYGRGPGYFAAGKTVDVAAFKAFQKETLPLRDEMMTKRVELRNEFLKEKPDQTRIATLEKQMIDLRTQIRAAAEKNGLPVPALGAGMGGRGPGWGGRGGAGPGYGARGFGPCSR